jgi:Xaa-Pro aminopeptidase
MTLNRRAALASLTTLGLALPALSVGRASAAAAPAALGTVPVVPPEIDGKSLINRPRAYEVMKQHGVDGLVALDPMNVYYLTNTIPLMTSFRASYSGFGLFSRNPNTPVYLVTGPAEALEFANRKGKGEELPELITYSAATNWQDYINASPEQLRVEPKVGARTKDDEPNSHGWAVTTKGPHTPIEDRWIQAQRDAFNTSAPTNVWALVKALREMGLTKATLAVDDMRIAYLLQQVGVTGVTCIPGENIFRRIRVVKSPVELALMRIAGDNNSRATEVVMHGIKPGMTVEDIQQMFAVEAAKLGNTAVTFLPGMAIGGFPDGKAVEGKCFAVDAVSYFRQYHGDCGRTLVIGEPSADIKARAKAHRAGYDEIYAKVKAGVKFSDLRRIGTEAMVKAGMPESAIVVNVHSVGVEHGDNPMRDDLPFDMVEDLILTENMVITVDLASLDLGWGNLHHEDLIRITNSGFEAYPGIHEPFVII